MSQNDPSSPRFETRAVRAGQTPDPINGAVMPPVYLTSTFEQDAPAVPRQGYEYSRTTNPTRTVLECACTVGIEEGMVIASSGLRSAVVDVELEPRLEEIGHWPGVRHARLSLRMSDGRAETVGEVRSLYLMWRFDLPRPELQRTLVLRDGRSARLDFLWEESRHCGEFDGMVKLGRLNPFGDGDVRALVQEKQREDAVRDRRWGMSRWGWVDLGPARRAATARMILEGLAQSRRLYVPLSTR